MVRSNEVLLAKLNQLKMIETKSIFAEKNVSFPLRIV